MASKVKPRRMPAWDFFDDNVEVCDVVRPGGLAALEPDDRLVAEWFIDALSACQRVLDVGCGAGFPGLYVARHVGELVGIDAAPNMVAAARRNSALLGIENARFDVGGTAGLPYSAGEFDGALLCGVLESMDWTAVYQMIPEVWRTLAPGGHVAVLDRDWRDVLETRPRRELSAQMQGGQLILRLVERSASPGLERDVRYVIDPKSDLAAPLRAELDDKEQAPVTVDPADVAPWDVVDAWYDEVAQFDAPALADLVTSAGFVHIQLARMQVWGGQVLLLTARKAAASPRP